MAAWSTRSILVFDTLLLALMLLLLAPKFTGLALHEWLGLAVVAPVLLHLLLSWNWIANSLRAFFTRATPRARVNFVLNAVLFILVVCEVVSGVMISQVALPGFGLPTVDDRAWRFLHNNFLAWLRIVVALHLAMNWNWVVSALRRWRTPSAVLASRRGSVLAALAMWAARSLTIVAVAALICGLAWWKIGPPSLARIYRQNEVAHLAGGGALGVLQIVLQITLLAGFAYVGRRWLRVRL